MIPFHKMQALGNDFVVIDALDKPCMLNANGVRHIADRHLGVGCDQLLLLEPTPSADADINYRIFNADGHEVEQCGNGARCVVKYLHENRGLLQEEYRLATLGGVISGRYLQPSLIEIDFGSLTAKHSEHELQLAPIGSKDHSLRVTALNVGNPHALVDATTVPESSWLEVAQLINQMPAFPEQANVNFYQVHNDREIKLRVHERGVGFTAACGSGALATAVALQRQARVAPAVWVEQPGGRLLISFDREKQHYLQTGDAHYVFYGEWP